MTGRHAEAHRRSLEDKEGFWLEAAKAVTWTKPPTRALDARNPPFYRWFPDGRLNVAANCLDRHVSAGRGDQAALIYDSPMTGRIESFSYRQLTERVAIEITITCKYGGITTSTMSGGSEKWEGTLGELRRGITIDAKGDGFTNRATFSTSGFPPEPKLPEWHR